MNELPHCPNPECLFFHNPPQNQSWWMPHGSYFTSVYGRIPRVRCRGCGRTFSHKTFDIDYYVKKRVDYQSIFHHLVTASGLWDITRILGVSIDVIQNRIERLARAAIGILSQVLPSLSNGEDFCIDGFESFSRSQYYPNNINILVGTESEYLYGIGLAVLRRKGRMTEHQTARREALEQIAIADPRATFKSVRSLMSLLPALISRSTKKNHQLFTDRHRAYPSAFRATRGLTEQMQHVRISSKAARTKTNPLFPVNYCDRQFRKDLSDHVRETVQFARCPSAMMSRLAVYQLFHNCIVPHRIRSYRKGSQTIRAEIAGARREMVLKLLSTGMMRRVFRRKIELDEQAATTWFMGWRNPGIEMKRYIPKYIFD
jgi:hypothetical protein